MSYYDNVAKPTQQAYQQSMSLVGIISSIAQVFVQFSVENSPDGQRLMNEASADLQKANADLEDALKRAISAQGKVARAARTVQEKDDKVLAMIGHMVETVDQADEHSRFLESMTLDADTLARNAKKVLIHDDEFIGWLLNEADEIKLKKVLTGMLSEERAALIKSVLGDKNQ